MLSLVIFDCDWVLFDSWHANVAFYNEVLRRAGLPPMSPEWERHAHYFSSAQLLNAMFADEPKRQQFTRQLARQIDYGPFYDMMEPVADLHATLCTLNSSYRTALASNRGRTVREVVRRFHLERYFEFVVGASDVERPKPFPDMIQRCLDHFAVCPQAAVYVGDGLSDREAANAAGVSFVAVGDHCWAPRQVTRLADLPALLSEF